MYKIIIAQLVKEIEEKESWVKFHDKEEFDNLTEPQYGYTKHKEENEEEIEIYSQITNKEIDIKKVIDAFNQ